MERNNEEKKDEENNNEEKYIEKNRYNLRNNLKNYCDGKHIECVNIAQKYIFDINSKELDNEFIIKYINHILGSSSYYNCLHIHNNKNSKKIVDFLVSLSQKYLIPSNLFIKLLNSLPDNESVLILKNIVKLDSNFINILINEISNNNTHLFNHLINYSPFKINLSKFIFSNISIEVFSNNVISKIKNVLSPNLENIIIDYLNLNKSILRQNIVLLEKIIIDLMNRHSIIKNIYNFSYDLIKKELHIDILNSSIYKYNHEFIIMILVKSNIKPNINTIENLIKKTYPKGGSCDAVIIAEIVDILVDYGLEVTKEIILKLLSGGCYINQIEKYNIEIDDEILLTCSEINYFPYKFKCKPNKELLLKECGKAENLENIKKLKDAGGIYTTECLMEACKRRKNGKLIKYLINECEVKPDELCIKTFQETFDLECLDLLIKNYNDKPEVETKENNKYEINKNCTLEIEPLISKENNSIDKNNEYVLKNKIRKFFNYKKKLIKYYDLYEIFLKYVIDNNLVISNYFVIDEKLSNLLNLNICSIIHIDTIDNILTYFIDF